MAEKNMGKYEIYKSMHKNLTKAMRNGFYYEAIFIEYAILEDRFAAVLKYAGLKCVDDKGRDFAITKKIGMIENRQCFDNKFVRDRLSLKLLGDARNWLKERNELIHHLATMPYDSEHVRKIAEDGNELVRIISNKSRSVINRLKKEAKNED